jgi:hypothetical protein
VFHCAIVSPFYTVVIYFNIIHCLSFSFPLSPRSSPLKQSHYYKHALSIYKCIYDHVCIYVYVFHFF